MGKKKGFVAGPFNEIPLAGFRANPLMAAVQKTKVRPILNLSAPKVALSMTPWTYGRLETYK
jgi:hypothetical protein